MVTHTENGVLTLQNPSWGRGDWMQTHTDRKFYPLDPRPEDISVYDIARGISMQCRYNGHVKRFYSVAEHCWHMSHAVPEEDALWALLHDATESYVGDMVRPLKKHMPDFSAAEDRVMAAIVDKFGLATYDMPQSVRDADNRILLDERDALKGTPPDEWDVPFEPLGITIHGWLPEKAEVMYLGRLAGLTTGAQFK